MEKSNKFFEWCKQYGTYALAGFLVIMMAVAVMVVGLNSSSNKVETSSSANNPVVSVNAYPVVFSMPMANATLIKDFSNDELYLNQTLGRWEYHNGIDLTSENLKVFAVADGTVTAINSDSLTGTTITISHSNNLVSEYSSLNSDVLVAVGDKVKSGEEIGTAGTTAGSESADGKHLHFSLLENGKKIDPANYLEFELK